MSYFVYILTNHTNTVLYTGVTNDIERRLEEHKKENKNSFTFRYRLYKMIYCEEFGHIDEAISAEKKIKGWTRKKKIDLIKSVNPLFDDLSK